MKYGLNRNFFVLKVKLLNIIQLIFFLLTCYFADILIIWYIKTRPRLYMYICCQLSAFINNFGKICSIKLKNSILYQINNTFWHTVFEISVTGPLSILWRLIFANVMRCSRLRIWVGYFIYFKFTPVFFQWMFLTDVLFFN